MNLATLASADPPRYRIIVIDPPDGVEVDDLPEPYMGINNRGEVVSTVNEENATYHPFVWLPARNPNYGSAPGMSPGTHELPLAPDRSQAVPREINVNGIVVGRVFTSFGKSAYAWNLTTGTNDFLPTFTGDDMHKEEAYDINDATPPIVIGNGWVTINPFITRGFRQEYIYPAPDPYPIAEILEPVLSAHDFGQSNSISDAGFAVGVSAVQGGTSECGEEQDDFRAGTWSSGASTATNLKSLGTPPVEAIARPTGVNNADPEMIVGVGDDPNDLTLPCRQRGLFWEDATAEPVALPYLTVNGLPLADAMQANAIADPFSDGTIQVVGRSESADAATLWRRVNNVWEAINLNEVSLCGGAEWANLKHACDINTCGWIAGIGTLTDGSPRAFVLIPANACLGDITGSEVTYPDGKVNVNDLIGVISKWSTSDCVADISGDSAVNVNDLLAVINAWGACACFPAQPSVKTLSQELTDAGLTQGDWNEYLDVAINGTQMEKELYNCWMQRLLSGCVSCPSCSGRNPFQN